MTRFKVFRYRHKNGDIDWVARGDKIWDLFHTWREAMDYADRMSRTVEVTLPRDYESKLTHITVERDIDWEPTKWGDEPTIGKPWMTITMKQGSIKDTALALLAHHHNNQDTP